MRLAAALLALALPAPALGAGLQSHCLALADATPNVVFASFGDALTEEDVRLHYIAHSTYLIETHSGLTVATDYTGFVGADHIPTVVTMNKAHSSHWTPNPSPEIAHVLRGWGDTFGEPARHNLSLDEEMLIRNVPTDIRSAWSGQEDNGNSIFVFEVAGLCIGHLGHLHHEPSEAQYAALGRLDVVMAPVDGGLTLPTSVMIKILKRVRALVVLPMHWFGTSTLQSFVAGMSDEFEVEWMEDSDIVLSLRTLPRTPTIRVLQPRFLAFDDD